MTDIPTTPYNPYHSFILSASAGSGKTYQLSKRFLFLVGSGADPRGILTITFTKKAAAEMRERILHLAKQLISNTSEQQNFSQELADFYLTQPPSLPKPLSPQTIGEKIIQVAGRLKIGTIDSIFNEWVNRFPNEAFYHNDQSLLHSPRLAEPHETERLNNDAWQLTWAQLSDQNGLWCSENFKHWFLLRGASQLKREVMQLDNFSTFIWFIEQHLKSQAIKQHEVVHSPTTGSAEEIFTLLTPLLQKIVMGRKCENQVNEALIKKDFGLLLATDLITKKITISASIIQGKRREEYREDITTIETHLQQHYNTIKLTSINQYTSVLEHLYQHYNQQREQLKKNLGIIEFSDLSSGVYNLFYGDEGIGARFLIHRSLCHVMIDEFQDTSRVQWYIFRAIAQELLAGPKEYGLPSGALPSIFIVGDVKQSIYGFREAEPQILFEAVEELSPYGVIFQSLDRSYRSAQIILDTVNSYFSTHFFPGFTPHKTAVNYQNKPVIPNHGGVFFLPLALQSEIKSSSPLELEANNLAQFISETVLGPDSPFSIYDKTTGSTRVATPRDICLLYRSSTHAEIFADACTGYGLSTMRESAQGFMARPEILDMLSLLKCLAFKGNLASLFAVLKSPVSMLDGTELLRQFCRNFTMSSPNRSLDILKFYRGQTKVADLILNYYQNHHRYPLITWLNLIMSELSWEDNLVYHYGVTQGSIAASNIKVFFQFCCDVAHQYHCHEFVDLLLQIEYLDKQGSIVLALPTHNAISLMTMHKAKGLEFPIVVLLETASDWLKRDPNWLRYSAGKPSEKGVYYVGPREGWPQNDLHFENKLAQVDEETRREEDRLFYVALTRSQQYLIISGHADKEADPYSYFAQLRQKMHQQTKYSEQKQQTAIGEICFFSTNNDLKTIALPPLAHMNQDKGSILNDKDMILNPQGLFHNWQPDSGYSSLKTTVPVGKKEQSSIEKDLAPILGTFIHTGLEYAAYGRIFAAKKQMQALLQANNHLLKYAAETLEIHFKKAQDEIELCLASDAWRQMLDACVNVYAEIPLVLAEDNRLCSGRADLLIEKKNREFLLIDYKSASLYNHDFSMERVAHMPSLPSDDELTRFAKNQDYSAQLSFYQKIVQQHFLATKVSTGIFFTKYQKVIMLN